VEYLIIWLIWFHTQIIRYNNSKQQETRRETPTKQNQIDHYQLSLTDTFTTTGTRMALSTIISSLSTSEDIYTSCLIVNSTHQISVDSPWWIPQIQVQLDILTGISIIQQTEQMHNSPGASLIAFPPYHKQKVALLQTCSSQQTCSIVELYTWSQLSCFSGEEFGLGFHRPKGDNLDNT
jgi:hypothetical protein